MSANLDLLRAVAVLCVFFAHLYETLHQGHTSASMHFGQLGVIYFFVHTSTVLMQSLARSTQNGRALFTDFYVHRFFRLYPLSITCVAIAYMIPGAVWTMRDLLSNLALVQNLFYGPSMVGGLWTLPLEVQMYVVLPMLFVTFRTKSVRTLLLFWCLSIPIALLQPLISGRLGVVEYVPCFLAGVIAWRLGDRRSLAASTWPVAIVVSAVPWLLSSGNSMSFRWISCLLLGLAIPFFREIKHETFNTITQTIAKYSYGIYLSHVAALRIAFHTLGDQSFGVQITTFVTLAVLFPLAAYHLIEAPMINYGRNVLAWRKNRSLIAAA
jgi:peptidoglycan/LPS O-acetylase OafA/YrhL